MAEMMAAGSSSVATSRATAGRGLAGRAASGVTASAAVFLAVRTRLSTPAATWWPARMTARYWTGSVAEMMAR